MLLLSFVFILEEKETENGMLYEVCFCWKGTFWEEVAYLLQYAS